MSHCLVYDGNKRLLPSAGLHWSGSKQRVSLILKHSVGCIKQNALYKVMGDIYSTLLGTNDIPAGLLSSLGATIGIAINPLFPTLRAKFRPVFLKGVNCRWVHNRVFRSTMASSSPWSQACYDEKTLWYCRECSVHWAPGSSTPFSSNSERPSKAHPGRHILKYFSEHTKKAKKASSVHHELPSLTYESVVLRYI